MATSSHHAPLASEDVPTQRLVTLRRLVSGRSHPPVFDQRARIHAVEGALREAPEAVVVLVDHAGVLQGTLRLEDLHAGDARSMHVEAVMAREAPIMDPESSLEAAMSVMQAHQADRVLVVTPSGELLGVLTDDDLRRHARRRVA